MHPTPHRVLLVDPCDTSAYALAAALDRRGLRVSAARDLERGLAIEPAARVIVAQSEALEAPEVGALLGPPQRSGAPALIVLLRDTLPAALRRAVRLGAVDALCQPIDPSELAAAIEEAARRAPVAATPAGGLLHRAYPARPESVERAARDLAAFALRAAVGPACRARLASACAEIVHNACHHAHAHAYRDGRVDVEATVDEREIVVTIRDDGEGFDTSMALARALELGFESGLGRATCLAESLDIESIPGAGTRVMLRFTALRADFDEARNLDLSELDFLLPDPARELMHAIQAGNGDALVLSPALAVLVGRLLAGPDLRRALPLALWS